MRKRLLKSIFAEMMVILFAATSLGITNSKPVTSAAVEVSNNRIQEVVESTESDAKYSDGFIGGEEQLNETSETEDEVYGAIKESGVCGDNLTWKLDDKGVLTIEGTGKMYNYTCTGYNPIWESDKPGGINYDTPWNKNPYVKRVVIKDGVTSIGSGAFNYCTSLEKIVIPSSVKSFGNDAFCSCGKFIIQQENKEITANVVNVYAEPYSYKGIEVCWKKMSGAVGYVIYRRVNGKTDTEKVGTVGDVSSYIDNFPYGTSYYGEYRVAPLVMINGQKVELSQYGFGISTVVDTKSSGDDKTKGTHPCINDAKVITTETVIPGVVEVEMEVYDPDNDIEEIRVGMSRTLCGEDYSETISNSCSTTFNGLGSGRISVYVYFDIEKAFDIETEAGNYVLGEIYVIDKGGHHVYIPGYYFDVITVPVSYEFDIEFEGILSNKYIARELSVMEEGKTVVLTIDGNSKGILKKECLDAIKGKDKTIIIYCNSEGTLQWVINGRKITGTTKDIDVRVSLSDIDGSLYGGTGKIPLLIFASNGKLPGIFDFRFQSEFIKAQYSLSKKMYLYYLSGGIIKLEDVDNRILPTQNRYWCYMPISHNSTFCLSGKKLNNKGNGSVTMYRIYNPNSGEHFYTSNQSEINNIVAAGWKNEGVAWKAPVASGTPVYRLYNPNAGDHHYTISAKEKNDLVKAGWKYEGIGWYSDDNKKVPLHRLYNPNAVTGSHHYTISASEKDSLIKAGWRYEGLAWYGMK